MKKILFLILIIYQGTLFAQYTKEDAYDYIDQYKDIAIILMKETRIPASIKLAQAIYFSGAGTNDISVKTKNHFGVTCQPQDNPETSFFSGNKENTCYRSYDKVIDSYIDHALFLRDRSRYNRLFFLENTDYRNWATGLQEAGYSANPEYARKLIEIIETYYLNLYDTEHYYTAKTLEELGLPELDIPAPKSSPVPPVTPVTPEPRQIIKAPEIKDPVMKEEKVESPIKVEPAVQISSIPENRIVEKEEKKEEVIIKKDTIIESGIEVIINRKVKPTPPPEACAPDSVIIVPVEEKVETAVFRATGFDHAQIYYPYTSRPVYLNNKVKFIIAEKGDTYGSLAQEIQISEVNLRRYNDIFDDQYEPVRGEVVYLQNKNNKSAIEYHTIEKGETMRYIAQKYAIPLKTLYKRNGFSADNFTVGNSVCISCKL